MYKALSKKAAGSLKDQSKAPKRVANKTGAELEERVLALRRQTCYGPLRLKEELEEVDGIVLSQHTIRNILRRNLAKLAVHKPQKKGERPFVDWSAIDVNSRFKLIAYSYERNWNNGLMFFLWVLSWLRSHNVSVPIVFTVDHGEEFGGRSWLKVSELRKLLASFGCSFIQNHKGSPQKNAHVERSHRTDDEEFYIPRLLSIPSPKAFFFEAMNYLYYYNVVRKHSALSRASPWQFLLKNNPDLHAKIRFVPPIFLDSISVQLGDWSGYHLLAHHPESASVDV